MMFNNACGRRAECRGVAQDFEWAHVRAISGVIAPLIKTLRRSATA